MSNLLIVNTETSQILGIMGETVKPGAKVELVDIRVSRPFFAYWKIETVMGGHKISLQNAPKLSLDLDASSLDKAASGTELIVTEKARFANSDLWSTYTSHLILSQCGKFLALNGTINQLDVRTPEQTNPSQNWDFTTIESLKADIDMSLIS